MRLRSRSINETQLSYYLRPELPSEVVGKSAVKIECTYDFVRRRPSKNRYFGRVCGNPDSKGVAASMSWRNCRREKGPDRIKIVEIELKTSSQSLRISSSRGIVDLERLAWKEVDHSSTSLGVSLILRQDSIYNGCVKDVHNPLAIHSGDEDSNCPAHAALWRGEHFEGFFRDLPDLDWRRTTTMKEI